MHRLLVPLLVAMWFSTASVARADNNRGAVVLTGNVDAKKQNTATAAVTSALRQAKWTVVDTIFNRKDVQAIQDCFTSAEPWSCLEPITGMKDISRVVLFELTLEKPGSIRLTAQLATSTARTTGYEYAYCNQGCSDNTLAQSAADLVGRLLTSASADRGDTFIEVISDPPGATISIDGRLVGAAGRKFAVKEGRYRVLAQLSGHRDEDAEIDVGQGQTKQVSLKLEPIASGVVTGPVGPIEPIDTPEPPRKLQIAMIAGGSALLVGGLVWSYATALDRAPPPPEPLDSKYQYNGKALLVAGVGGAVAVGGLVWMLLTPTSTSQPTVSVTPDSVQAGWSLTF
jgi:hypothetical protein